MAATSLRLIVTRPAAQAAGWIQDLQAAGLDAVALPLIGIAPPSDLAAVQRAWQQLPEQTLVMFVSANAVEQFFAARPARLSWPSALTAASTGPGTTAALHAAGVTRVVAPSPDAPQFDSEALWSVIHDWPWAGASVYVVRGEEGRDWLAQRLQAAGAQVQFVSAYRRLPPQLGAGGQAVLEAALAQPLRHAWLFSSSEAVGHLQRLVPAADWGASWALASHPRIAQAAHEAGFGQVDLVAPGAKALVAHLSNPPPTLQSRV